MIASPPSPSFRSLAIASALAAVALVPPGPVRAADQVASMVRALCLKAFEAEMSRAGKTPPPGMASYACSCVADRISSGSSIEAARSSCRDATARRYPI
ncbi:MAG: hypothetical protein ACKOPN_03365 [Prochlorococcaceae cyanobacterium]